MLNKFTLFSVYHDNRVESRKWENPAVSRRSRDETYRPYWSRCEITSGNRILSQILAVWILGYFDFFFQFHRVQNYNWLYRICWSLAISNHFVFCSVDISVVNFRYIVLWIVYQFLFPSIKQIFFIHSINFL
jgi:hypothetical protein